MVLANDFYKKIILNKNNYYIYINMGKYIDDIFFYLSNKSYINKIKFENNDEKADIIQFTLNEINKRSVEILKTCSDDISLNIKANYKIADLKDTLKETQDKNKKILLIRQIGFLEVAKYKLCLDFNLTTKDDLSKNNLNYNCDDEILIRIIKKLIDLGFIKEEDKRNNIFYMRNEFAKALIENCDKDDNYLLKLSSIINFRMGYKDEVFFKSLENLKNYTETLKKKYFLNLNISDKKPKAIDLLHKKEEDDN